MEHSSGFRCRSVHRVSPDLLQSSLTPTSRAYSDIIIIILLHLTKQSDYPYRRPMEVHTQWPVIEVQ